MGGVRGVCVERGGGIWGGVYSDGSVWHGYGSEAGCVGVNKGRYVLAYRKLEFILCPHVVIYATSFDIIIHRGKR